MPERYILPDQREAAYSPDGKSIVISSQNGNLTLWNASNGNTIRTMPGSDGTGIPPTDAIKIAPINGARALKVGDKLSSIEIGKLADLEKR